METGRVNVNSINSRRCVDVCFSPPSQGTETFLYPLPIICFGLCSFMPATMASSSGNDDDLTIPRAAINKMIKETLPNVRVANDARELVVNCCTEFIHLISSEANEICNKSDKKTISPEHVINGECWFCIVFTQGTSVLRDFAGGCVHLPCQEC